MKNLDGRNRAGGTQVIKDRLGSTILGLVLLLFGYFSLTERYFTNPLHPGALDLGDNHQYFGIATICIGILFILVAWRRRPSQPEVNTSKGNQEHQ
jgi:hypothetical protein